MKITKYFTLDTLLMESTSMLQQIQDKVGIRQRTFTPEKSALLILDMQKFFLYEDAHAFIPSASAIIPGILKLAELFIRNELPVFITRHVNTSENAGQMIHWWRDMISPDDELSQILPIFSELESSVIIKNQYDAFYGTSLEKLLRKQNVQQLIITGVMTHLCCETTARSAFIHGFEVFFPVDGTATYNKDFHNATLLNLAHGFACLTFINDMLDDLRKYEIKR